MEKSFYAVQRTCRRIGGIQAIMKSIEDDKDIINFSQKLDELVVKMYCKWDAKFGYLIIQFVYN